MTPPGCGLRAVQEQLHPTGKAGQRERAGQRQRHLGRVRLKLWHTGRPEHLPECYGGLEQCHERVVQPGTEPVHPEKERPAEPAERIPASEAQDYEKYQTNYQNWENQRNYYQSVYNQAASEEQAKKSGIRASLGRS